MRLYFGIQAVWDLTPESTSSSDLLYNSLLILGAAKLQKRKSKETYNVSNKVYIIRNYPQKFHCGLLTYTVSVWQSKNQSLAIGMVLLKLIRLIKVHSGNQVDVG